MTEDAERSALERKYFEYLKCDNIQQQFNSCSVFRILLYTLRERLLQFIEERFKEFINEHHLSDDRKAYIKLKIKEEIRDYTPTLKDRSLINKAKDRNTKIDIHTEYQITVTDWRTIAQVYTGNFISRQKVYFDPKNLLEILLYCKLFSEKLYAPASLVLEKRNTHYGHIPHLIIDSGTLDTCKSAIESLLKEITA